MGKEFVDLLEFQSRLKEGIEGLFPCRLWLRAEVGAVKARQGGHCWLELLQSGPEGMLAKANAVIWSSKYRFIAPYFESVTGLPIQEGMVVLLEVQVNYSPLYGFSLVVNDIDPEYTLGQREVERRRTLERLQKEGLIDLQKELSLPALPRHIAVVSAEDAAGYRDFVRHIEENPYGFSFCVTLYPALMQGENCPSSIIAALDAILASEDEYDGVFILRGGGAKLDLACYDDYDLAAVIAQYPLPVLTAVGHDQDRHVCDMVANVSVKTPTALADYLLAIYEDEDARLLSFLTRIRMALISRMAVMETALTRLETRIRGGVGMRLAVLESGLDVLEARIRSADPRRIMDRGYALAVDADGVVLKSAAGSAAGDRVAVMFSDGVLNCTVDSVDKKI